MHVTLHHTLDVSCCRLIMCTSILPTHSLHLALAAMSQIPAWFRGSNLELHNAPPAAEPCARYNGQSRHVQSSARNGTKVKCFFPGCCTRSLDGPQAARRDWRRLFQQLGWRDAQHAKTGTLMTLARFHYRVLSPLRVYEVWKSIWPGLEVPCQLALPSSPPVPSRLRVLSWGLCSAWTFDPALLPTACRSRDSAASSWAAPAYWPQRLCWLSRPLQWKYCWFFCLFSALRRWKRFSSGNKTLSILVNVKGPLCLHWYFTSEPFSTSSAFSWCGALTQTKDGRHVSVSPAALQKLAKHSLPAWGLTFFRKQHHCLRSG